MSMYRASVPQLAKMLRNLDAWLDKAVAHATAKGFAPDNLLEMRLAPDQYPLVRQIQAALDAAKLGVARLADKEAPKHPDTETTIAELKKRLGEVLAFFDTVTEADFAGAAERVIALPFLPPGKTVLGRDYLNEMALPNFYFHLVTSYALLRHNGVDVGKVDFIGSLTLQG